MTSTAVPAVLPKVYVLRGEYQDYSYYTEWCVRVLANKARADAVATKLNSIADSYRSATFTHTGEALIRAHKALEHEAAALCSTYLPEDGASLAEATYSVVEVEYEA